ncbi:MAG: hypothetical protein Q9221_001015 [Calogaya cf. arnoldii]
MKVSTFGEMDAYISFLSFLFLQVFLKSDTPLFWIIQKLSESKTRAKDMARNNRFWNHRFKATYARKEKPFPLLRLPRELRHNILEYVVPHPESVDLSKPRLFIHRQYWEHAGQPRCDPPILSVNKQLYEESCDILCRSNFIITINCCAHSTTQDSTFESGYLGPNLFPFHRAKQITLRMIPHRGLSEPDHLFHHMLYVCGLLFSKAKSIKHLSIEVLRYIHRFILRYNDRDECPSWTTTGRTGVAEQLGLKPSPEPGSMTEYISLFLRPLELPGRVANCQITVSERLEQYITLDLQKTLDRYKKALTDGEPFSYEETKWLWDEYMAILDRKDQLRREHRNAKQEKHQTWLLDTHQTFACLH